MIVSRYPDACGTDIHSFIALNQCCVQRVCQSKQSSDESDRSQSVALDQSKGSVIEKSSLARLGGQARRLSTSR